MIPKPAKPTEATRGPRGGLTEKGALSQMDLIQVIYNKIVSSSVEELKQQSLPNRKRLSEILVYCWGLSQHIELDLEKHMEAIMGLGIPVEDDEEQKEVERPRKKSKSKRSGFSSRV